MARAGAVRVVCSLAMAAGRGRHGAALVLTIDGGSSGPGVNDSAVRPSPQGREQLVVDAAKSAVGKHRHHVAGAGLVATPRATPWSTLGLRCAGAPRREQGVATQWCPVQRGVRVRPEAAQQEHRSVGVLLEQ